MKIAILGYSGSGKSTLAKHLSSRYRLPLLYLDTVQFEENWKLRDRAQAMTMVSAFMQNESWVIDGNYASFFQKERLEQADCIVYMAFPRFACLYRAFKRYRPHRNRTRESMAEGCVEKIDLPFIWWILFQGRSREKRRYYRQILAKYPSKTIFIKNQRQLDAFMAAPPMEMDNPG